MSQFNFPASTQALASELLKHSRFKLQQIHEWAEWIGYETRNKYSITDLVGNPVGFAAEQQKGMFAFVMRQFLGHWRRFNIDIFNTNRELALRLSHPFRWFFQRIEVFDGQGVMVGALQQKFAFFTKSFDVEDPRGKVRYQVRSPLWKFWTFKFTKHGHEVAEVQKRWSGLISEVFTDRDNFLLTMKGPHLDEEDRLLILAASIFVDLQYFERKAR